MKIAICLTGAATAVSQEFVDLAPSQCPQQGGVGGVQSLTVPQGTRKLKLHLVLYGGSNSANVQQRPEFPDYVCKLDTPIVYAEVSFSVQVKDASGSPLFEETFAGVPSTLVVHQHCGDPDEFPPLRTNVLVRNVDLGAPASGDMNVTVESHYCLSSPSLPARSSWMTGRLSINNSPLLGVFSDEDGLAEQRDELYADPPSAPVAGEASNKVPVPQNGPAPSAGQTIRVALGQVFGWGMARKGTNEPVECTFALDHAEFDPDHPIVDDSASYKDRPVSLFKDQVLLPFGFDQPQTRVTMVGLHLGTQYFRATPTDGKTRAAVVKVEVLPPHALGKRPYDLDTEIVEVANRRGIPPQWIKGNVQKEARKVRPGAGADIFWDRETWRYEPLSIDLVEISRGGSPLRARSPYQRYRMATQSNDPSPSGFAQGVSLTQGDIDFRDGLMIKRDNVRRPIAPTDADVTVREIIDANLRQNWHVVNAARWRAAEEQRSAGNDPLTFNAQTTLATSYGLIQPMYANAIRFSRWHDPFGPSAAILNPSLLMDTAENLADGEGSLHVATVQLLYLYKYTANGGFNRKPYFQPPYPIDKFASFTEFEDSWRKSLRFYNVGMVGYADAVLEYAEDYRPQRTDAGIQ